MSLSFAQGEFTERYLSDRGVYPDSATWRWHEGVKGGVFPEHVALNQRREATEFDFGDHPDTAVNAAYCQCIITIGYRDTRGRFAKPPNISDFAAPVQIP